MALGQNILNLRKKNGLSQEQLGEKVNVTRQTISNWELEETAPNPEQLKLLSKELNISIDELLGNNIKKFRNLKKMTQDELADLLGTTSKSISRWEQDITYPDITMLPIIANVFNITVDELLGVERIKQEEYVKEITYKANEFQKNNDIKSEVLLWEKAYKEFPNNEEIICNLISSMVSFNIINNKLHYTKEIEKLSSNILDKCTNNNIRLIITKELINYYSQMGNKQMAEYYCKQLPNNLLQTYNVMRTRYLKNDDLIKSENTVTFLLIVDDFFNTGDTIELSKLNP